MKWRIIARIYYIKRTILGRGIRFAKRDRNI